MILALILGSYTNLAGNVVSGTPVALDRRTVSLSNVVETVRYPLSIFPESEQRRIATDFGQPRVPPKVRRAIDGAEKAMARSRKRAEMGLCTKEESEAFCTKSSAALKSYLDRQVQEGAITPAERQFLGKETFKSATPSDTPPDSRSAGDVYVHRLDRPLWQL